MDTDNGPGVVTLGEEDRARAVAAVKAVLRVELAEDDALIAAFVESALGLAEQFVGKVGIARELSETVAADGCWHRLAARPVRAITGVEAGGVPLAVSSYALDLDARGGGWVRVGAPGLTRVTITYCAGLASGWDDLPAGLREGAVLLAAHLLSERSAGAPVPAAVTALWRPHRVLRLAL
jgi:uncharacterized phiE125 gp8 family phage protein